MAQKQSWAAWEDAVIREVYPRSGRKGVVARLPRRTEVSVKMRAKFLRVQFEREDAWSDEGVAYVEAHYAADGYRVVAAALGRKPGAVASLASLIEVARPWTQEEDAVLRRDFPTQGAGGVAARLCRNAKGVGWRAKRLGVVFDDPASWSADEDAYLIAHYSEDGPEKVAEALGFTYSKVTNRASFHSLPAPGKLTEAMQERLRAMFATASKSELEAEFKRPFTAIAAHAYRLGLERPREKFANASRLLDGSLQAAYWIGFLLADGYLSGSRIEINLAPRDRAHLEQFAQFMGNQVTVRGSASDRMVRTSFRDVDVVPEIARKWGFKPRKTYNPPPFSLYEALTPDERVAVMIGLFDGDGTTDGRTNLTDGLAAGRRLSQGRLALHRTWSEWLTQMVTSVSNHLEARTTQPYPYTIPGKDRHHSFAAKLAASGNGDTPMVRWLVTPAMMRAFKRFIDKKRLVVLERKWWFNAEEVSRRAGPRYAYLADFQRMVRTISGQQRLTSYTRNGQSRVWFSKQNKGWCLVVCFEGTEHYLGTYPTARDAHAVADAAKAAVIATERCLAAGSSGKVV